MFICIYLTFVATWILDLNTVRLPNVVQTFDSFFFTLIRFGTIQKVRKVRPNEVEFFRVFIIKKNFKNVKKFQNSRAKPFRFRILVENKLKKSFFSV